MNFLYDSLYEPPLVSRVVVYLDAKVARGGVMNVAVKAVCVGLFKVFLPKLRGRKCGGFGKKTGKVGPIFVAEKQSNLFYT